MICFCSACSHNALGNMPHGFTNAAAAFIPTAPRKIAKPRHAYKVTFCAFSPITMPQSTANRNMPYAKCHAVANTPRTYTKKIMSL